jgi:hypothetical protein
VRHWDTTETELCRNCSLWPNGFISVHTNVFGAVIKFWSNASVTNKACGILYTGAIPDNSSFVIPNSMGKRPPIDLYILSKL